MFDPFDLTHVEVRWQGRPMGAAVPHVIGRHAHPKARPEIPPPPPAPTGIDYLRLVAEAHDQHLGAAVNYAALTLTPDTSAAVESQPVAAEQIPGQLDMIDLLSTASTTWDQPCTAETSR